MNQSQVSLFEEQQRSPETSFDRHAMIKDLGNQLLQNGEQINTMETFLQNKYSQIADLQKYLIEELQEIQNKRSKNERLEKLLVTQALPSLQDLKNTVLSIKQFLQPICYLATNYLEALSEKCKCLLEEKQEKINRYEAEVIILRQQVRLLKERAENSQKASKYRVTENSLRDNSAPRKQNIQKKEYLDRGKSEVQTIDFKNSLIRAQSISTFKVERILSQKVLNSFEGSNKSKSKSPIKNNKYQQCYRNIVQKKKTNISYRCDRSPTFENMSPCKNVGKTSKVVVDGLKERKDYIKLKIEKIKSKGENRDCWDEGDRKGRLK